jgi:hypothetical protein
VESVDLRFSRQVVVNPEHEPAQAKPVEAAVRSSSAAGAHRSSSRRSN